MRQIKHRNIARDADYLTSAGAMRLAQLVERYWWDRGHPEVMAWIEAIPASVHEWKDRANRQSRAGRPSSDQTERYHVRSNLINGLPPRVAMRRAA